MKAIAVAILTVMAAGSAQAFDCSKPAPEGLIDSPDCTQWSMTCGAENALKQMTPIWDQQILSKQFTILERRFLAKKYAFDMGAKSCHHFDFVQAKAALDAERPPSIPAD